MMRPSLLKRLAGAVALAALTCSLSAQISISGLTGQTVYTDSVTFTVEMDPGYEGSATLDAQPLPLSEAVKVASPDYHELSVLATNQTSGAVATQRIQFIVRASERGNSEWGLPPWTPYPVIPSTAAELAGAELELLAPSSFPVGLEIPIVARLRDQDGHAVRASGVILSPDQPPLVLRRGIGSGFLAAHGTTGPLEYRAELPGVSATKSIVIEPPPTWTPVSGELSGAVDWPEDSRIAIVGSLSLPGDSQLMIGAGTVIKLDPGVDLVIDGQLFVDGSSEHPVVFTPASRSAPWGGFLLRGSAARLEATGTMFIGSGANANWFDENPGYEVHRKEQALFLVDGAEVALTNCFAIDHYGQFGHGENGRLTLDQCLVQRFITGGEYNGGAVRIYRSALIEFPEDSDRFADDDNDAIYFTTGAHEIKDTLIGWAKDDGIDHGSGGAGTLQISNCWVEACFHEAFAWSGGGRVVDMIDSVSLNSGQGIEAGWSTGSDSPLVSADHCLSIGNLSGARFGDNYDWTYNGHLTVTNSFLLFNYRDVYGLNWSDWTYREAQMDLQNNWLTNPDPRHLNNQTWDPAVDSWRLAPFMTTPPDALVGVGLALRTNQLSLDRLVTGIPIGLSTFTTNVITVHYSIEAINGPTVDHTLRFLPGETVKRASADLPPEINSELMRFFITAVEGGEVTGQSEVWILGDTASSESASLVPAGSTWFYLDDGSDQGTAWTQLDFDHSGWRYGPAELGYGESSSSRPEATVLDFGPDSNAKYITYYFRHLFLVDDPADYGGLILDLQRDDGAVVHLNGHAILTNNMPATSINYLTRANLADDDGAQFHRSQLTASFLQSGTNVLAVEVHQESPTSSDVSFDLGLEATPTPTLQLLSLSGEYFLIWWAPGFVLEHTSRLPENWETDPRSSPAPVSAATQQHFYRLRATSD